MAQLQIKEIQDTKKVQVTISSDKSLLNPDIINTIYQVYDIAERYRGEPEERNRNFPERNGKRTVAEISLIFPNLGCLTQFRDDILSVS